MAYLIENIKNHQVQSGTLYFFDANIWVFILQSQPVNDYRDKYLKFFNKIINAIDSGNFSPPPKIVVNSILISEILNVFLHGIAFKNFKEGFIPTPLIKSKNDLDYKKHFRGTTEYQDAYDKIVDDILAYEYYMEFKDDLSTDISARDLIFKASENGDDFNDYFYFRWCKRNNFPIVTNDGDFKFEDVKIITVNNTLLALR